MPLESLGLVTVATGGIPVRLSQNETDPTVRLAGHSLSVQAWHANTGKIYIGDSADMNTATGDGVLAVLAIPTANVLPQFNSTIVQAAAGVQVHSLWLDAEVDGESALVTVLRA